MDGFAGFPLRSSTPRGSAFVEFTRSNPAPAAPQSQPAPPSLPTRQESLSVLRGGEKVSRETMQAGEQTPPQDVENEPLPYEDKAALQTEDSATPPDHISSWSKSVTERFAAVHGMTPSAYIGITGDHVTADGTIKGVK